MSKSKDKIKIIMNNLINESYPLLKEKKIMIHLFSSKKYLGGTIWIPFIRILSINKDKSFNDSQLRGLLAHELGHLETFKKKRMWWCFYYYIRYWTDKSFRKKEEQKVERLLIKKGYARDYYSFVNEFYDIKHKNSEYYFSPKKIKSYAQNIGKW